MVADCLGVRVKTSWRSSARDRTGRRLSQSSTIIGMADSRSIFGHRYIYLARSLMSFYIRKGSVMARCYFKIHNELFWERLKIKTLKKYQLFSTNFISVVFCFRWHMAWLKCRKRLGGLKRFCTKTTFHIFRRSGATTWLSNMAGTTCPALPSSCAYLPRRIPANAASTVQVSSTASLPGIHALQIFNFLLVKLITGSRPRILVVMLIMTFSVSDISRDLFAILAEQELVSSL